MYASTCKIIRFLNCQELEPDGKMWPNIQLELDTTGYPVHPYAKLHRKLMTDGQWTRDGDTRNNR